MDHAFLLVSPCSKTKTPCYILLHLVQVTIEKMVDEDLIQITHPRHRWHPLSISALSLNCFAQVFMVQLRALPAITFENIWCHKLVDWIQGLLSKLRIPQVPATAETPIFGTCKNFDLKKLRHPRRYLR